MNKAQKNSTRYDKILLSIINYTLDIPILCTNSVYYNSQHMGAQYNSAKSSITGTVGVEFETDPIILINNKIIADLILYMHECSSY